MIGLATENGRVERIDGRTGTPIWEEAGPVSPVAMALGKGGVGVAASGGAVWIWHVP
jgi:outer membrane protein assembly factor BamB